MNSGGSSKRYMSSKESTQDVGSTLLERLKLFGMGGTKVVLVIGVATSPAVEAWVSADVAGDGAGGGGFLSPGFLASGGRPLAVVGAGGGGLGAPRLPKKGICGLPRMAMTVGLGTALAGGARSLLDLGGAPGGIGWAHPPVLVC